MLNKRFVSLPTVNSRPLVSEEVFWSILSSLFNVPLNRRTWMESIFWTAPASERFSTKNHIPPLSNHEQKARKIEASSSTFLIEHPSKSPELASKKIRKAPVFQRSKWIKIDVCPGGDLQRFYPSDQTHPDELNLAWRRTFHERDSLSLVRLMKSSTFDLGLTWTTVRCKWNKSYKTCGNEIKSRMILAVVNAILDAIA